MVHHRITARFLLLAGLLGLSSIANLSAQSTAAPKASIKWPDATRPALTYSIREVPFDGVNITIGLISGSGISWENKLFQSWLMAKDPGSHSIAFTSKLWPGLRLGISVFGPNEFLPDISDEVWGRYLAGLQLAHDGKCDILDQLSATVSGSPWIPVLGAKTRSVTIRYPAGEGLFSAETQLFAFCPDRLVVFVISGPEQAVQAASPAFYATVRSVRNYSP